MSDARVHAQHALSGTRAYQVWAGMQQRCYNPGNNAFPYYGGRGIKVCARWMDVAAFIADMGHPPDGMSIDRIDNDGDYCPENCRWATIAEQNSNTRRNRYITWNGLTLTQTEWAQRLDIEPRAISERLRRGWTVERALTTPRPTSYQEGRRKHLERCRQLWSERGRTYKANSIARRQEPQP